MLIWAGAVVQWLWDETRNLIIVGLNPSTVLLDGHFFTLICGKKCIEVCFEKTKNKRIRGRRWPIFKRTNVDTYLKAYYLGIVYSSLKTKVVLALRLLFFWLEVQVGCCKS